jgi:hypothetical protein
MRIPYFPDLASPGAGSFMVTFKMAFK